MSKFWEYGRPINLANLKWSEISSHLDFSMVLLTVIPQFALKESSTQLIVKKIVLIKHMM